MAATSPFILSRIEWCRRQRTQARTQSELEGWRAEEEGLQDAILGRDRTSQYRYSPPGVFRRYAMGLRDGRSLILLARVDFALGDPPPIRPMSDPLGDLLGAECSSTVAGNRS
jgi:hypothetical protein